jgi:invasion protein IalB
MASRSITMKETEMSLTALPRKLALSLGLAAFGFAPLAFAQETAPSEPAPVVADAPTADNLSMGTTPGAEEGGIGSNYVSATFEQWEQRCVKTEDGSDPCQLYQLLKDQTGNAVAEISLFALPDGGQAVAGATVVVPLETLLTANLTIAIDTSPAKIYPFTFCAAIGCVARVGFTAEELTQFKKGAKATISIVPAVAPDQKVNLDLSLKGFTAGYDAVALTAPKAPAN